MNTELYALCQLPPRACIYYGRYTGCNVGTEHVYKTLFRLVPSLQGMVDTIVASNGQGPMLCLQARFGGQGKKSGSEHFKNDMERMNVAGNEVCSSGVFLLLLVRVSVSCFYGWGSLWHLKIQLVPWLKCVPRKRCFSDVAMCNPA